MTVQDNREAVTTPVVPRPRAAQDDIVEPSDTAVHAEQPRPPTVGEFPWPEPWHFSRGARPRSEFWDVATASWHSRGPIFPARKDD